MIYDFCLILCYFYCCTFSHYINEVLYYYFYLCARSYCFVLFILEWLFLVLVLRDELKGVLLGVFMRVF